jgi:hypothetical protein
MAERAKLDAIGRGATQHQRDMEALQAGAMRGGSLTPHPYQAAPAAPADPLPPAQAGETPEEAAVPSMQAANAKSPGLQDKLNAVAKARAKFYGEGV